VNIFVHAFLVSQNSNKRICSSQQWDPEDTSRAIIIPRQTLQRYLEKDEITIPKLGRKPEMGIEAEN
jgi:hypothetical protein